MQHKGNEAIEFGVIPESEIGNDGYFYSGSGINVRVSVLLHLFSCVVEGSQLVWHAWKQPDQGCTNALGPMERDQLLL